MHIQAEVRVPEPSSRVPRQMVVVVHIAGQGGGGEGRAPLRDVRHVAVELREEGGAGVVDPGGGAQRGREQQRGRQVVGAGGEREEKRRGGRCGCIMVRSGVRPGTTSTAACVVGSHVRGPGQGLYGAEREAKERQEKKRKEEKGRDRKG